MATPTLGDLGQYVHQPSGSNLRADDPVDLVDTLPYIGSVGRTHFREIAYVRLVGNQVLARLKIKYLFHELVGKLRELLDPIRRREGNLLAFETAPRDDLTFLAHMDHAGSVFDTERSASAAAHGAVRCMLLCTPDMGMSLWGGSPLWEDIMATG
ncbi:MAG: hypothetical protein AAB115_04995 [Pseudomonadota bacterium]